MIRVTGVAYFKLPNKIMNLRIVVNIIQNNLVTNMRCVSAREADSYKEFLPRNSLKFFMGVLAIIAFYYPSQNALAQKTYTADPSLIPHWRFEPNSPIATGEALVPPPFLALFHDGQKYLGYVGTSHRKELSTQTFLLIKEAIQRFKPDIIIIEGYPEKAGLSPKDFLKETKKCWDQKGGFNCGEIFYAVHLANLLGIPFIGGDPLPKEEWDYLETLGYDPEDYMGFNFVRKIPQEIRSVQTTEKNLMDLFQASKERDLRNLGVKSNDFTYASFLTWFEDNSQESFETSNVSEETYMPDVGPEATFIQNVSGHVNTVREANIISTIAKTLNKYDRVLVVYGSSHYAMERRALKKMLGTPSMYIKKFSDMLK